MTASPHLANWSGPKVAAACYDAYKTHRTAKTESYRAYVTANPHLKADNHEHKAVHFAAALLR